MRKTTIFSIVAASAYFVFWVRLAIPYRPFPSDPLNIMVYLSTLPDVGYGQKTIFLLNQYCSVYFIVVEAFYSAAARMSGDPMSGFVYLMLASNCIAIFFSGALAYRLTSSITVSVLVVLVYSISAWPVTYLFLPSYTTFASALLLGSLLFLVEASRMEKGWTVYVGSSAVICALMLWGSSSAILAIVLDLAFMCYLFNPFSSRKNRKVFAVFLTVFATITIPLLILGGVDLMSHLTKNAFPLHEKEALERFGYVPVPPLFTFFRIGWVYSPVLFGSFALLSPVFIVLKKYDLVKRPVSGGGSLSALTFLAAMVWVHLLVIDILPFTKLARTHFAVYPLMVVTTVGMVYYLVRDVVGGIHRLKHVLYVISAVVLAMIAYENISVSSETAYARTYTPRYLSALPGEINLYVVDEDPHAKFMVAWLYEFDLVEIRRDVIEGLAMNDKGKGTLGVLIGPSGKGSGMSVLKHAVMQDMDIDIDRQPYGVLPYYAYYPPFLIEEEVSQALYFEGRMPDYRDPEKNIRLFVF